MSSSEQPWHAAFPAPTHTAEAFPLRRALLVLSMKISSMLIVDVRRTDYEGGAIRGSLNIPAQGFWWNRGPLYELAYKADVEWVVFTCGSCKENSRGAKCAGWFLDHVRNTVGDTDMQVMVLEGGIKGWVKAGKQYTDFMDGFDQAYWDRMFADGKPTERTDGVENPSLISEAGAGTVIAKDSLKEAVTVSTEAPKEKVWSWEAME